LERRKGSLCKQLSCGHVACLACLRDYYSMCVEQGFTEQIKCVNTDCGEPVVGRDLEDILIGIQIERLNMLREKRRLESKSGVVYCTRKFCQAPIERDVDSDDKLVVCTKCGNAFCCMCKRAYHGVQGCRIMTAPNAFVHQYLVADDETKLRMEMQYGRRTLLRLVQQVREEEAITAYLRDNTQACPDCGAHISKSEGCNHMACTRCHCHFCFLCGSYLPPSNPYGHFSNRKSACYGRLFENAGDPEFIVHDEEDALEIIT